MRSGDLVPFQEFGSLSLKLLMDELAAAEAPKETKRGREEGVEARESLFVPCLLHKSFAHDHIVMERCADMSTPAPAPPLSFRPVCQRGSDWWCWAVFGLKASLLI